MDYVRISGTIDSKGFTPDWWSAVPLEAQHAVEGESGPNVEWLAVALGENERILSRAPISLSESSVCASGFERRLWVVLAIPDGTLRVAIIHGGRPIFHRIVPERATLRLSEPLGPELRRQTRVVPLSIEGPEPRPGAYLTASWEAPNHPPVPLGLVGLVPNSPVMLNLDLSVLPGGDGCRLSVAYFDGIRSVRVSSEQLSLQPRPAVPVIVAPAEGMQMLDDGLLTLTGRLEGDGDPEGLEWLLDEEVIATGARAGVARPAAGTRTVALRYGAARSSVVIKVLSAPVQEVEPLLWEPPWRSVLFQSLKSLHVRSGAAATEEGVGEYDRSS